MTFEITPEFIRHTLQLVVTIGWIVRDLKRIPSGELYVIVQGQVPGWSLGSHEMVIQKLIDAGMIQRVSHELIWIGPPTPAA